MSTSPHEDSIAMSVSMLQLSNLISPKSDVTLSRLTDELNLISPQLFLCYPNRQCRISGKITAVIFYITRTDSAGISGKITAVLTYGFFFSRYAADINVSVFYIHRQCIQRFLRNYDSYILVISETSEIEIQSFIILFRSQIFYGKDTFRNQSLPECSHLGYWLKLIHC